MVYALNRFEKREKTVDNRGANVVILRILEFWKALLSNMDGKSTCKKLGSDMYFAVLLE